MSVCRCDGRQRREKGEMIQLVSFSRISCLSACIFCTRNIRAQLEFPGDPGQWSQESGGRAAGSCRNLIIAIDKEGRENIRHHASLPVTCPAVLAAAIRDQ